MLLKSMLQLKNEINEKNENVLGIHTK